MRAYATEHARAEAEGNNRLIGLLERRFAEDAHADDTHALQCLRREAGKLRRRYNANLSQWMSGDTGQPAGRRSVRGAMRSTTPRRRKLAAMQACFLALCDHLGTRTGARAVVGRVLAGEIDPQDATMAVGLRFYRRLKGECSGCGGQDARATGVVCGECGL